MIPYEWLQQAADRIAPHIRHTPLTYDARHDLFLKWENHQVTGSFKARGAVNKVLSLQPWERERGLVAASAGNHGQGVALAGDLTGASVTIFCSEQAVASKIAAMRALGADVRLVAGGYGEAEHAGLDYSAASGAIWISPYNDSQVIAGQGTLGLEIGQELPSLADSTWVVPAGGGGLVSGIGAALEQISPRPRLVAVQSEASAFLHAIFHHGDLESVIDLPTLADGLAGPVENGSVTIPLVRHLVDDFVLVSEAEIQRAIGYAWKTYGEVIEGSAAAALACVLSGKVAARPAVVVLSGGNIQPEVHAMLIAGFQGDGFDDLRSTGH